MADAKGTLAHSKVVFPLHGISTHARWQRTATDVLHTHGWICRLDRWHFGYFSVFRLLIPWQRKTKILWFRDTYDNEVHDSDVHVSKDNPPSVIAHSFGTYILGNALLTYKHLYFDKVLLCGSILPRNFPWDDLINRGQVQAVRDEYSGKDRWARIVRWFVRGAGPSGRVGFSVSHEREIFTIGVEIESGGHLFSGDGCLP